MRPGGFIIDVPVIISVAIRGEGLTEADAKQLAREFVEFLEPSDELCKRYATGVDADITETSFNPDGEPRKLEELEPEPEEGGTPADAGETGRTAGVRELPLWFALPCQSPRYSS